MSQTKPRRIVAENMRDAKKLSRILRIYRRELAAMRLTVKAESKSSRGIVPGLGRDSAVHSETERFRTLKPDLEDLNRYASGILTAGGLENPERIELTLALHDFESEFQALLAMLKK